MTAPSRRSAHRNTVTVNPGRQEPGLPALIRGTGAADLVSWLSQNPDTVTELAHSSGAVLFRGFGIDSPEMFRSAMAGLARDVLDYGERSSPRHEITQGIYTSTDHPADQHIALHNEQSYTLDWPLRIVFCCQQPATTGGRTPLADSRRVLARLSAPTVARFGELGVRYVRNYLPGISLPWQEAFQTSSRAEVESYCAQHDISCAWADGEQLRTWQVRPAIRRHPGTGEETWFNHALFFNNATLASEVGDGLLAAVGEDNLPYHTYFGDGSAIPADTIAEIQEAYRAETVGFDWERGDVLLVENMLVAHAREPFDGPRRILTAMADRWSSVTAASGADR
ncbi:TauD/TfdA family dioxygenase [Streptomyces sp. NBC_00525]|uniref:TauD/TfdA family dioxygenase n=1 Tax=Streptomyces sp. NBC_00525 TaxID=2903660 RepID=UPI002E81667D|nr:TauD/TfdA family dioxygenase [Streptomyces sp. NBC_00525]WUC95719.1 TauD/TfdA family dioxygenase [Streptomyces sp. NBC_00525]